MRNGSDLAYYHDIHIQAELLQKAHEHNENHEGFTDRIMTRYSDEVSVPEYSEPQAVSIFFVSGVPMA